MGEPVTIFVGATGLTTKRDPVRLQNEEGLAELAQAVNVDVTDSSRVRRRKGYTKKSSTGGHSLFCEGGPCLLVSGGSLCYLASDYTVRPVATLEAPDRRMRYAQVPTGEIYFGNGIDKGVFLPEEPTVDVWIADIGDVDDALTRIDNFRRQFFDGVIDFAEYSSQTEDALREAERFQNDPLPPHHLEHFAGRLFASYESILIYSAPWIYDFFDLAENYIPFDSPIRMLRRAVDGLYVGTQQHIYFLSGLSPDEFSVRTVSNDPPIEHTDVRVQGEEVSEDLRGDVAMFTSTRGVCLAGPGGSLVDYTKRRVDLPPAMAGSGIVYDGAYLSLLTL